MSAEAARRRWQIFGGLAVLVVVADQLSKAWVVANFSRPTEIVGDLLRITIVHNTGGIFGLFGDSAAVLALASTAVIGLIVLYQVRAGLRAHWLLSTALGLLLGGAIGNLVDRIRLGYVVDFVDAGMGELRWYTFNVADAAISMSLVLLVGLAVLGDRLPRPQPLGEPHRP